jgi:hypothetical protein
VRYAARDMKGVLREHLVLRKLTLESINENATFRALLLVKSYQ